MAAALQELAERVAHLKPARQDPKRERSKQQVVSFCLNDTVRCLSDT